MARKTKEEILERLRQSESYQKIKGVQDSYDKKQSTSEEYESYKNREDRESLLKALRPGGTTPSEWREQRDKEKQLKKEAEEAAAQVAAYEQFLAERRMKEKTERMTLGRLEKNISDADSKISKLQEEKGSLFEALKPGGVTPSEWKKNRDEKEAEIKKLEYEQSKYKAVRDSKKSREMTDDLPDDVKELLDMYNALETSNRGIDLANMFTPADRKSHTQIASQKLANEQQKQSVAEALKEKGYDNYKELAEYRRYVTESEDTDEYTEGMAEFTKEHPVLSSLANLGLMPSRILTGAVGTVNGITEGKETDLNMNPKSSYYALTRANTAKRETIGESFEDGRLSAETKNFLYGTAESAVESLLASATMGPAGGIMLGLGAMNESVIDSLEKGHSSTEAFVNGVAAGAFEMIFESVSLGNLKVMKEVPVSTFKDAIKNVAKSAVVNFSEEAATEMANLMFDYWYNGGNSQYYEAVTNLVNQGYSEEEAKNKVILDMAKQVGQAGLGGALMGTVFGAYGSAAGKINDNAMMRELGEAYTKTKDMDALLAGATDIKDNKTVDELLRAVEATEKARSESEGYQYDKKDYQNIGNLVREVDSVTMKDKTSLIETAVRNRLEALGEKDDIDRKVSAITKTIENYAVSKSERQKLTRKEKTALKKGTYTKNVITEAGELTEVWADRLKKDITDLYKRRYEGTAEDYKERKSKKETMPEVKLTEEDKKDVFGKEEDPVIKAEAEMEKAKSEHKKALKERLGEGYPEDTFDSDYELFYAKGKSGGFSYFEIDKGTDGEKSFFDTYKREAFEMGAYHYLKKQGNIKYKDKALQVFTSGYSYTKGTAGNYKKSFDTFYSYGADTDLSFSEIIGKEESLLKFIDKEVAEKAFIEGRKIRDEAESKKAKKVHKPKKEGTYTSKTTEEGETDTYYEALADKLGIDIVRKQKLLHEGRKANGLYYRGENKFESSASSHNEYQSGIHELVHHAYYYNAPKMKEIAKSIKDFYIEKHSLSDYEKMMRGYVAAGYENNRAELEEEFTADALAGIFSSDEGVNEFLDWLQNESGYTESKKKSILEKLADWILEITDKIKELISEGHLNKTAEEFAESDATKLEGVRKQFLEALDEIQGGEGDKKSTPEGGVKMSSAGVKAKTANIGTLNQAIKLEDVGKADAEEIRRQTGWFRGMDGKWRFEIDDSQMKINDIDITSGETKLSEVLDHPALFAAYPQLKDITVSAFPSIFRFGTMGSYSYERQEISLSDEFLVNTKVQKELAELKRSPEYRAYKERLEKAAREHGEKRLELSKEYKKIYQTEEYRNWTELYYQLDEIEALEKLRVVEKEWKNSDLGKRYYEIQAELKHLDEVNPQAEIEKEFRESDLGKRYRELEWDRSGKELTNNKETRSTLIHEIQHAVQQIEDFASGSSPSYWAKVKTGYTPSEMKKLEAVKKKAESYFNMIEDESVKDDAYRLWYLNDHYFDDNVDSEAVDKEIAEIEARGEALGYTDTLDRYFELQSDVTRVFNEIEKRRRRSPDELYRNTAGEIEARDTSKRLDMTAEERKNTRPDLDRKDVVFAEGSVSYDFGVTQEDIDRYVDAAYKKENTEDYKKYAEPSQKLISDVSKEIDINGYVHALRDNDIRHIRNSHGEETNEKYPVTSDDIKLIPWIVEKYDKVYVKTNARNKPGIVYVKATNSNIIYYVEAVTEEYHNEKLLVNKQMIKAGFDEIPNLHGLISAINKKESSSQYLADLEKIRKAYVQDVKGNYFNTSISNSKENVKPSLDWVEFAEQQEKERSAVSKVIELERINDELRAQIRHPGEKHIVNQVAVQKVARKFKSEYLSKIDIHKLSGELYEFYGYLANDKGLSWDAVQIHLENLAGMILNESKYMKPDISEYAKDILRDIRSVKISLNEKQKNAVASEYGSYNNFRKKNMGTLVLSNEGMSLDQRWQELSDAYPSLFPKDTADTDQPEVLMLAIESLRSNYEDAYGFDLQSAKDMLMTEIYEQYFEVPETKFISDEYKGKLEKAKAKYSEEIRTAKAEFKKQKEEAFKRAEEKYKEILKKELNDLHMQRKEDAINALAWYEMKASKLADTRVREKKRANVIRQVKRLNRLLLDPSKGAPSAGTNKYGQKYVHLTNIPEPLRRTVIDFCSVFIDHDAGVFSGYKKSDSVTVREKKVEALKKQYDLLKESDSYLKESIVEEMEGKLDRVAEIMAERRLSQLSAEELDTIIEITDHLITVINNQVEIWVDGKKNKVETLGKSAIDGLNDKGMYKFIGFAKDIRKWGVDNLKPIYFFEKVGGPLEKLYLEIQNKGQRDYARNINNAAAFLDKINEKYDYQKWMKGEELTLKTTQGHTLKLTKGQAMLIYATARRESIAGKDAMHLWQGGIVFKDEIDADVEKNDKNKLTKNIWKFKKSDGSAHRISVADVLEINNYLTKEEKQFVDEMVGYLSNDMAQLGNEVSMELYGVRRFNEKYYIPFNSAKTFIYKSMGQQGEAMLKSESFTKETSWGANNPLVVDDFVDVVVGHIERMCMYNAMVIPLENFNRVWNYNAPVTEESTKSTESVRSAMTTALGSDYVGYVDTLLKDINGGVTADGREKSLAKLLSNFKKTAVLGSASVVIQQPSAIVRAMAEVNPVYFADTRQFGHKKRKEVWETALKYSSTALLKDIGGFDTVSGKGTVDWLTKEEYEGKDKILKFFTDSQYRDDVLAWGPAFADKVTWVNIWLACEKEVKANNRGLSGEELNIAVGKRFDEVINKTQVYDSVMTRSAHMRSKSSAMQVVTSFMAEPTTQANMISSAIGDIKGGDRKKGIRKLGAVAGAQLLNATLVSIIYASRDDDEDKTLAEKYIAEVTDNFLSSLNPVTMVPLLKDIWSILEGYDVKRNDMSVIDNLIDSIKDLSSSTKTNDEKILGLIGAVGDAFGIPLKNLIREVYAAGNIANSMKNTDKTTTKGVLYAIEDNSFSVLQNLKWWKPSTKDERLYAAFDEGDKVMYNRFASQYKSGGAVKSALKGQICERFVEGDIDEDKAMEQLRKLGFSENEAYYEIRSLKEPVAEEESGDSNLDFLDFDSMQSIQATADAELEEKRKEAEEDGKTFSEDADYSWLREALKNADKADIEYEIQALLDRGVSESSIISQVKSWLKDNDEDVFSQAQKYEEGDLSGFEGAVRSIAGKYGVSESAAAGAIRSAGGVSSKDIEGTIYTYGDLHQVIGAEDSQLIQNIGDKILKAKTVSYINEGKSQKDALSSARGSMRSSLSSKWKEEYIKASSTRRAQLRRLFYATGAWENVSKLDDSLYKWLKND